MYLHLEPLAHPHLMLLPTPTSSRYSLLLYIMHLPSFPSTQSTYLEPLARSHLMLSPTSSHYSLLLYIMHLTSFPSIQSTYLTPFHHFHLWITYMYMHIHCRLLSKHPFACCCEVSTYTLFCFPSMMSAFFKYNQPSLLSNYSQTSAVLAQARPHNALHSPSY